MLSFPVSPGIGQRFQGWAWDGVKWTPTRNDRAPKCGLLKLNGSSPTNAVIFVPRNGDEIKINGLIYRIPSAGIVAMQGSLYLDKVAGSSLAQGPVYYVYVFFDGTAVRLNFSTTGHATSTTAGNVGTEIRQGDDSQTLVGILMGGGTAPNIFYDQDQWRYTRSWFNRPRAVMNNLRNGNFNFVGPAYAGLVSVTYLGFSDDVCLVRCVVSYLQSSPSTNVFTVISRNATGVGPTAVGHNAGVSTPEEYSQYRMAKSIWSGVSIEGWNEMTCCTYADYASNYQGNFTICCTVAGTY